ncbi:hypothetical protein CHS0354_017085 [Potamilus streckersoni]|uniref:ABC-type oligopeptide transporter ABCB9 n=1 Tax=Potamilus streckersoni TaxID=2493646 RepID=A0AAE0SC16_9BIVA|nr:hypothetical protein CHS0354_017085 [Potamilus streckersoni]
MKRLTSTIIVAIISIVDITVTTILFTHGKDFYQHFMIDVWEFAFDKSLFDLWLQGMLRFCVQVGILLALLVNMKDTLARLKSLKICLTLLLGFIWMFTFIKLLVWSETEENLYNFWFWLLFSWTLFSAILVILQYKLIQKIEIHTQRQTLASINDDNLEECKPLLGKMDCHENSEIGNACKPNSRMHHGKKTTILRLLSYSKPDTTLLIVAFFFLTAAAVGEIFVPFYTGKVVDGIVIDKSEGEFTNAIIMMSLISLGSSLAAGLRGGCLSLCIGRLNIRIRSWLFSAILKQEIGFFDSVKTGDITSRLTSDTSAMGDTVSLNINIFLRNFIKGCGVVFFMFKLSWRLSVITIIGVPTVYAFTHFYGHYFQKLSKAVQDSLAKANEVAEEACSSMKTVRSFANEKGEITRYDTALKSTYAVYKKRALCYAGSVWTTQIFELALTISVLYYGGHLVMTGKITGGNLVSFILYQMQLGGCIDEIGSVYTGLMQALGASEKVFEYMDRQPKVSNSGAVVLPSLRGHIEFKNVCFSYPSRPDAPILKNVSFQVMPGEVVALVGPSGGGKTSCINLLEHFYEAQSGEVLLDSVPVQEYDHHFLHREVCLVSQEPILSARSLLENISYGLEDGEWTVEDIHRAAMMANAHQFIVEMKDSYETEAGEKGLQLSGGQKQRIAIARALIRNPTVLILDEATSALDAESEYMVQQAIYKNLPGRTVLIIAHRLSTVERANRIIVIDKGCVVEEGNHKQLLLKKGLYANLVHKQLLSLSEVQYKDQQQDLCICGRARHPSSGSVCRFRRISVGSRNVSFDSDGPNSPIVQFVIGSL